MQMEENTDFWHVVVSKLQTYNRFTEAIVVILYL